MLKLSQLWLPALVTSSAALAGAIPQYTNYDCESAYVIRCNDQLCGYVGSKGAVNFSTKKKRATFCGLESNANGNITCIKDRATMKRSGGGLVVSSPDNALYVMVDNNLEFVALYKEPEGTWFARGKCQNTPEKIEITNIQER